LAKPDQTDVPLARVGVDTFDVPESFVRHYLEEAKTHLAGFLYVAVLIGVGVGISLGVEYAERLPPVEKSLLHLTGLVICACGSASAMVLALASLLTTIAKAKEVVRNAFGRIR
jgi:hypothetical protein